MKKLMIALAAALACAAVQAQQLRYRETTGGRTAKVRMAIEADSAGEGRRLSIESDESAWRFALDRDGATVSCDVAYADGSGLALRREGGTISAEGKYKGKPVSKVFSVDASPWLESMELGLAPFALGGSPKMEFWSFEPGQMKAFKMTAARAGKETIECGGTGFEAVKVRVTASGVPAVFYSVAYWFRASDGRYLRFEGARGGPGTGKTVAEYEGED